MRRAHVLFVVAACGSPAAPPSGPIVADVTHYDLAFDLDSRAAHATVTATIATAGDCWSLPFRAQDVANVTLDGKPAQAQADGTTLTACGDGYEAGAQLVLDVDETIPMTTLGGSQVGYTIKKDSSNNTFYYLLSWVNECDRFLPCDPTPSAFATYHFDVTHTAATVVRCSGDVADVSATETTCDFTYDGGPTYSTFGVVGYNAWAVTDEGTWGGVHVTLYDRATTGIAAKIDPAYHDGYVKWLESEFGPFPYGGELRLLTGPTYWSGFEHPTNITLADNLASPLGSAYSNDTAHTIDHEIAHMWAGDQTTLAGTYDFAWKESMAEYLSYVWEDTNDPQVGLRTAGVWRTLASRAKYFIVPDDHPDLFSYYGDVYGAGPMIFFRQLEVMSSRQQVLAAIQSVLGQPQSLSVDALIAALQQHTGIDLTQYAQGWVHGTGVPVYPHFALVFTPGTGTSTLLVHQTNVSTHDMGCKFHVALEDAAPPNTTQSQLVEVDTFANGSIQQLSVPTPAFTVGNLELDPLHECLVFLDTQSPRDLPRDPWLADRGAQLFR